MGIMTFGIFPTMETGVLDILAPVRITLCPYKAPTPDFVDRGHLDRENDILESMG